MSTTRVRALKPPKSVFDGSYEKKFDFDFGQLIPVCCEEMVPGDTFKFGNEIVIRFQPMFAPVLQEINAYVHYFFVPTRLIWDDWEEFITGGESGPTSDLSGPVLPRYKGDSVHTLTETYGPYSLYDYFGFPLVTDADGYSIPGAGYSSPSDGDAYFYRPLSFPWRCVNLIWNEYYRDETLQEERSLDDGTVPLRNWSKDYFTSALHKQQRGVAPALPISGVLPVTFSSQKEYVLGAEVPADEWSDPSTDGVLAWLGDADDPHINGDPELEVPGIAGYINPKTQLTSGSVNLSGAATINVSDLRLIYQVQKWMERNERSGVRYTSFLHAHYGVSPRDDRLQRPEYLGGSKSPIIVSEVVQTSESSDQTTPTGRLYGKGITADKNYVGSYHAQEFGYLVGLLSVLPKATYQQGVDRQWLRKSRYDFFASEFSHLSEQEVTTEELYAFPGDSTQSGTSIGNGFKFGYQARYNEMRANKSKVCGSLRDTLDYWHLGRQFSTVPQLNADFITCDPERDDLKRIFQVQNVPGMICNFANILTMIRPIPKYGEPGLVDHN